jgi:hypothetical protein
MADVGADAGSRQDVLYAALSEPERGIILEHAMAGLDAWHLRRRGLAGDATRSRGR